MKQYKKFDKEKAIAGAEVITRDGKAVYNLTYFENIKSGHPCFCAGVDNEIETFYLNGSYYEDPSDHYNNDLFMAPVKYVRWVNVNPHVSFGWETEKEALRYRGPESTNTVKVEWEE